MKSLTAAAVAIGSNGVKDELAFGEPVRVPGLLGELDERAVLVGHERPDPVQSCQRPIRSLCLAARWACA